MADRHIARDPHGPDSPDSTRTTTQPGVPPAIRPRPIRRKAIVGPVDDPAEVEADRTADAIVQFLGRSGAQPADVDGDFGRIRRSAGVGEAGGELDDDTSGRIQTARGGTPLQPDTRNAMEQAFGGSDFGKVRIHAGPEATMLNDRLRSNAFTSGNNIWFRGPAPDISRQADQRLLAHELTHVVQNAGTIEPMRRHTGATSTIRRKDGDEPDFDALKLQTHGLLERKMALTKEIEALEAQLKTEKVRKAQRGIQVKIRRARAKLASANKRVDALFAQLRPLKEAQDQAAALAKAKAEEEERLRQQAEKDGKLKTYSEIAALSFVRLVEYVARTPNWHERSTLTESQRDVINEIHTFASIAENGAPCAKFTIAGIEAAAPKAGGSIVTVLDRLAFYVAAAGDKRDPIEISVTSNVEQAATTGAALQQLLGGFPKWVLSGALTERALKLLISEKYVADVIAYAKFATAPPTFQAEDGDDFMAYLRMRLLDKVDPVSFQSGPLVGYIRNFHRFEAAALQAVLTNLADTSKTLPLTIVLHSAIDYNGAFHRDPNMTEVLTNPKILALLIEGGEKLTDYQSMITPMAQKYGNNDKIDQVMFAGHGDSRAIELAGTTVEDTTPEEATDTISQDEEPIDLDKNPVGAQAFFDEILANMDKSVVDPLLPPGPAPQVNRRILFNACLTNSNEVAKSLTENRATARQEIRDYITDNASLATYMATYAKQKQSDIVSLGANASITQVDLIDPSTGRLDLIAPDDPMVTASKLDYVKNGNEPHGVMLAALESWAFDPAATRTAMHARSLKKSDDWDQAVIEGCFEVAWLWVNENAFGTTVQELADTAHEMSEVRRKEKCRVSTLAGAIRYFPDDADQVALIRRLSATKQFKKSDHVALVLAQVDAAVRGVPQAVTHLVKVLSAKYTAKTARDFIDVEFMESEGLLGTELAKSKYKGRTVLAATAVLDKTCPASAKNYLKKLLEPGAPLEPALAEVPAVPEVPEQDPPRALVPEVPAAPGRPKLEAIPDKRTEHPAIAELPKLPELPEVVVPKKPEPITPTDTATKKPEDPTTSGDEDTTEKGTTDPVTPVATDPVIPVSTEPEKAPGRPGRDKRAEVPEVPQVKPYFAKSLGLEAILDGRALESEIAEKVS